MRTSGFDSLNFSGRTLQIKNQHQLTHTLTFQWYPRGTLWRSTTSTWSSAMMSSWPVTSPALYPISSRWTPGLILMQTNIGLIVTMVIKPWFSALTSLCICSDKLLLMMINFTPFVVFRLNRFRCGFIWVSSMRTLIFHAGAEWPDDNTFLSLGSFYPTRRKLNQLYCFLAVLQPYETRVGDVFVIAHNEAILSCSLPSHAGGFLEISSWVTSEGLNINRDTRQGS